MSEEIIDLLREAKQLGQRYYQLTGKPLGVTAEVAEYEAFRLLGLTLVEVRNPGFDAISERDGRVVRYQIKGRCFDHRIGSGQRVGSLSLKKEWDVALLVLLDPDFEAREIWEASRDALTPLLTNPGSKSRTERGQIGVNQFKRVGKCIWRKPARNGA